jgi:hypothetical protein
LFAPDREDASQCGHTLREAIEFLEKRGLEVQRLVAWLHEHGGYCDCEVIFDVDDTFGAFFFARPLLAVALTV